MPSPPRRPAAFVIAGTNHGTRFSRTTSKHSGQLRPIADTEKVTKDEPLDLLGL